MRRPTRTNGSTIACLVFALLVAVNHPTDARARYRQKRRAVPAVLQPFLAARSVAHAVAEPIVFDAPRAVAAMATIPIRVAYHSARPARETVYDGELADDEGPAATEPLQVAYTRPACSARMRRAPSGPKRWTRMTTAREHARRKQTTLSSTADRSRWFREVARSCAMALRTRPRTLPQT